MKAGGREEKSLSVENFREKKNFFEKKKFPRPNPKKKKKFQNKIN